jgi:peptidoglycan/LPS O-acetylase OafA/YrhL
MLGFVGPTSDQRRLFYMYFPVFRVPEMPPVPMVWRRIALLTGCLGFVLGFCAIAPIVPGEMISNGLLMPFLGLTLFGLAHSRSRVFNHPLFVRLGDASYSLYLLHIPIWNLMARTDVHLANIQSHSPNIFFLSYLISVICASLMSLRFIETPARRLIRKQFERKPSTELIQPLNAMPAAALSKRFVVH